MAIPYLLAQDAIKTNANHIPVGTQAAGYSTGIGDVPWDEPTFAAHHLPYPAIRIDQDPKASDATADILDVESFAATIDDIPGWLTRARANYTLHVRPEQRWPGIYCAMNNLDAAVAICQSNRLANVPFWTAEPGNTVAYAIQRVITATGPYPCTGCQYGSDMFVDYDVFNENWVKTMAGPAPEASTLWHGVAIVTRDGTVTGEGKYWVVPIESKDEGLTYLPTGPGEAK
jgi:hypothetical protein